MRRETWYRLLPAAVVAEGVVFGVLQWLLFPVRETPTATPAVAVEMTFLLVILGGIVYAGHFSEFATLDSDEIRQIYAVVLVGFGCLFIFAVTDVLGGFLEIPVLTRALAGEGMLIVGILVLFAGIKSWSDYRERREAELARARDELASQTDRLETQRDNLTVLNQVLRHDVRNDLQLLLTYAELLEDHVDAEGEEYLDTVLENTTSAIDLTKTAGDIAETMLRADAERTDVRLDGVLRTQVDEARKTHENAAFRVVGAIPQVAVTADEMLASVFRNLLTNAVVHNDSDAPAVTVSAEADEDSARVRVADNGPGIPPERCEEIFGEGEQGLDSEGTGLGLFLVRTLVDSYGGDVWVEAEPQAVTDGAPGGAAAAGEETDDETGSTGAVFVVELPLAA